MATKKQSTAANPYEKQAAGLGCPGCKVYDPAAAAKGRPYCGSRRPATKDKAGKCLVKIK